MKVYPRESVNLLPVDFLYAFISCLTREDKTEEAHAFEQQFAQRMGCKEGIAVSSGRFALALLLQKMGLKAGDEVILPSFTYHAVPRMLTAMKLRPVFVDSRENDFTIDPALLEQSITAKAKAIIPTHLFGQPAEMKAILEIAELHDIFVIEDSAQAIGAAYRGKPTGSLGDAALFSLSLGKNLGGIGRGGIITTNNRELAEALSEEAASFSSRSRLSSLKSVAESAVIWGLSHPTTFRFSTYPLMRASRLLGSDVVDAVLHHTRRRPAEIEGIPKYMLTRFPDFNVKILSRQLVSLNKRNEKRIALARVYDRIFESIPKISVARPDPRNRNIYTAYGVRVPHEHHDRLQKALIRKGIDTQTTNMSACSDMGMFGKSRTDCPIARGLADELIHLPISSRMSKDDARYIANRFESSISSFNH